MGSKIDFANANNRTFKEVADQVTDDLITNGMTVKKQMSLEKI